MTAQTLSAQIELCFRLPAHSRAGLESLFSAIRLAAGIVVGLHFRVVLRDDWKYASPSRGCMGGGYGA